MAFLKRFTKGRFYNTKFKQNKTNKENFKKDYVTTATISKLGRRSVDYTLPKHAKLAEFKVWRAKAHSGKRKLRSVKNVRVNAYTKTFRVLKIPVFFKKKRAIMKVGKITPSVLKRAKAAVLRLHARFSLSANARREAIARYNVGATLSRIQGVYIWALLQSVQSPITLLKKYQLRHPKMNKINKQLAWEKRQWVLPWFVNSFISPKSKGRFSLLKKVRFHISTSHKKGVKVRLALSKKRYKVAAWRRIVLKQARHWKFKGLKSKLRHAAAHTISLRGKRFGGSKIRRKALKIFRNKYSKKTVGRNLSSIRDFATRDKVRIKFLSQKRALLAMQLMREKERAGLKVVRPVAASVRLHKKYTKIVQSLKVLENPRLFFRKKGWKVDKGIQTRKALAIFNNAFLEVERKKSKKVWKKTRPLLVQARFGFAKKSKRNVGIVLKRRLRWMRWFKVLTTRYNMFKDLTRWSGINQDFSVEQGFNRLYFKKQNKKATRKQGYFYKANKWGVRTSYLKQALNVVRLKALVSKVALLGPVAQKGAGFDNARKSGFFSLSKAHNALDFNKMFNVNKVTSRLISEVSNDLYTHYLVNLQAVNEATRMISTGSNQQNIQASRALRKYIQLLRLYFKEVYDNKLSKKIPASSAMHWIREYLRLTSGIKRRTSLWNRFNKVAFHFRPKAKEDEKHGRKKKILFKAKILFDRLFNWLYAQPNARYALAAPIQNGIVRDYIVRNQFIFKKQFKVKLASTVR